MKPTSIFDAVWRFDFSEPGFFLLELGAGEDSHSLRAWMVSLKAELSEIALARTGKRFIYRSMGRFNQQTTTKFHIDGAPAESLLILGYEPSSVRSRLFLADYSRCAFELGIEPQRFLDELNPMYRRGEEALAPYGTELPQPENGHYRILVINNSSLPFTESRTNPLGLMHKAVIADPNEAESRIVNSMMLTTADESMPEEIGSDQERAFVTTEQISPKVYG